MTKNNLLWTLAIDSYFLLINSFFMPFGKSLALVIILTLLSYLVYGLLSNFRARVAAK